MTTFIKAVAEKGAEIQLIEVGYFGIPKTETALDRGLAEVNANLRKELTELRSENKRLTAALEAISGTIAIYRAHQP